MLVLKGLVSASSALLVGAESNYGDIERFALKTNRDLYSQQKQDRELTVSQIMNCLLPNSDLN